MFCISSGRPFIENSSVPPLEPVRLSPGEPARLGLRAGRATQSDAGNAYRQSITDKPIIKVPGCPPIPDVMRPSLLTW